MMRAMRALLPPSLKDAETDNGVRGALAIRVPRAGFAEAAGAFKEAGFRLAAEWATDETAFGDGFRVWAAFALGAGYSVVSAAVSGDDPGFPSLTGDFIPAYRFERQINCLMGLRPVGHPDLRPWIMHEDWPSDVHPLRKTFDPGEKPPRVAGQYPWVRAEGEGVFEIAVGPVHAGIIEPGHFRFQAVGEDVINLETRFGYVHKGIEKRFEALGWEEGARLAARISGDSAVAHSLAYSRAVEAASGAIPPERSLWLRALLLERERIANHLGDIGAICNDTAFAFLLYQFSILRERLLRTNKLLFGHRLLMDCVVPGGVKADIELGPDGRGTVLEEMRSLSDAFERLVGIYEGNASLEDRVHGTGVLRPDAARALAVVGFVARSSGVPLDARLNETLPPYDRIRPRTPLLSSGDVHARTWVRIEEVRESIRLIREFLGAMPEGPVKDVCTRPGPGASGFSTVEGWRGEIVCFVQAGPEGRINRCMVRDPSSVNWLAIEYAIKGNIVPDFPLINKSFNQSYSGHDL
jgi:Ni,Fe-hydrogenase III large subunit/Ni,Fe-hydrogenase III component G